MATIRDIAINVNYLSGTAVFNNTKTVQIDFKDSNGNAISFTKEPRIQITQLDASAANIYKVKAIKTGALFTGFIIGFQNAVSLSVEWQISERA